MGKIVPKKKRISIRSPQINMRSHVEDVRDSLEKLIFSSVEEKEKLIFKKRLKVVVALTAILIIFSSYFSPKGEANSSTFYPTTCLGGWSNSKNAEGEPQLKSNENEADFTKENSATLQESTKAEMYCGGFVGEIEKDTKPTKIAVFLSWSKGNNIVVEQKITGESFASSSLEILDVASTTEVSFSLTDTSNATATASSSDSVQTITDNASTTSSNEEKKSFIDTMVTNVGDVLGAVFDSTASTTTEKPKEEIVTPKNETQSSDTVVPKQNPEQTSPLQGETIAPSSFETKNTTPLPQKETSQPSEISKPTSFFDTLIEKIAKNLFKSVYAEENATTSPENNNPDTFVTSSSTQTSLTVATQTQEILENSSNKNIEETSSSTNQSQDLIQNISTTTESLNMESTTTEVGLASSSEIISLDTSIKEESNNAFLEVLYTFDGVVWKSLGKVDEQSMKYRSFEIPVTSTTSWKDLNNVQIKIQVIDRIDVTPSVYIDGITLNVLYETPIMHEHPDFSRDTLLKDMTDDGVRVITINNSDTNTEEIWYTTVTDQGEYGVAPSSWVQVSSDENTQPYSFIDIYGQNIFLLDDAKKMIWVKNLQKETNDGVGIILDSTTTAQFMKSNGEEWIFEYHYKTKNAVVRIKG